MNSFKETVAVLVMMLISGLAGFAFYYFVIAPRSQVNYIETRSDNSSELLNLDSEIASNNAKQAEQNSGIDLSSLVVKDMQAKPVALDQWPDKLLVINFWATWCPPCRKEIPLLIETQKNYADKNVQFLGIAMDDSSDVARYMQQTNFNYPILISDLNETIRIGQAFDYNFIALPFTLFVSADGKTSKSHTGELDHAELTAIIDELSAKTPD